MANQIRVSLGASCRRPIRGPEPTTTALKSNAASAHLGKLWQATSQSIQSLSTLRVALRSSVAEIAL